MRLNRMPQALIDRLNEMLEYCVIPRTRQDLKDHFKVSGATISYWQKILVGTETTPRYLKVKERAIRHAVAGNWLNQVTTINYPFVPPETERERHTNTQALMVESPFLRNMFGFTDYVPDPEAGDTHAEDKAQVPMPRVRVHQRVYVSGSTLSGAI